LSIQDLDLWNTASGAELINAMGDGRFPMLIDIPDGIGQAVVSAEPGRVELTWTPTEKHCTPSGAVHGGFIAMVLDNAVTLAGCSLGDLFNPVVTLNLSVEYLRPVMANETYVVVGSCVHSGKTRMVSTATLTAAGGKLAAQATASSALNQAFAR